MFGGGRANSTLVATASSTINAVKVAYDVRVYTPHRKTSLADSSTHSRAALHYRVHAIIVADFSFFSFYGKGRTPSPSSPPFRSSPLPDTARESAASAVSSPSGSEAKAQRQTSE